MESSSPFRKTILYVLIFIFTLHVTPATYINSSFLGQFLPESYVGYVFSVASVFTIIAFIFIRRLLTKIGNFKTALTMILLEVICLLTLVVSDFAPLVLTAYIIGFILRTLIMFSFDIFLENISKDDDTGSIRGIYLTSLNIAFLIGPIISSLLLTDHNFWKVYLFSTVILIPVIYIMLKYMRDFKDPVYEKPLFFKTAKRIYDHCNLYGIFFCAFLLRFFFSWMIIYTPIYLNQHIGFSLSETTLIIGVGLIPFVLLEALLGWLADTKIGEKEILTGGFIITAIATASISFINVPNMAIWMIILFITRVGAVMIEITTESYLFKKIDSGEINVLSFFRVIRPVAYVVSPIIASILLTIVDFKFIFLILGAIMLYGIRYSLAIRDTL